MKFLKFNQNSSSYIIDSATMETVKVFIFESTLLDSVTYLSQHFPEGDN